MADAGSFALKRHSPLAGLAWPEYPGCRVEPWAIAELRRITWSPGEEASLARALGCAAMPDVLRSCEIPGSTLLRLGPEEALLVSDESGFERKLPDVGIEGIELSHSLIGMRLSGADVATFLALGCPIDVHPKAFPPGMATRTLFGKFEVMLWRRTHAEFRLLIARSLGFSFSAYLGAVFSQAPV